MLKSLEWYKTERANRSKRDVHLINKKILLKNELVSLLGEQLEDNDTCCIEVPEGYLYIFYEVLDDLSSQYTYIPDGNLFIITEIEL